MNPYMVKTWRTRCHVGRGARAPLPDPLPVQTARDAETDLGNGRAQTARSDPNSRRFHWACSICAPNVPRLGEATTSHPTSSAWICSHSGGLALQSRRTWPAPKLRGSGSKRVLYFSPDLVDDQRRTEKLRTSVIRVASSLKHWFLRDLVRFHAIGAPQTWDVSVLLKLPVVC